MFDVVEGILLRRGPVPREIFLVKSMREQAMVE